MDKKLSISGTSFTVEEIGEFIDELDDAPLGTRVRITHSLGDRPWESIVYTLSASYPVVKDSRA